MTERDSTSKSDFDVKMLEEAFATGNGVITIAHDMSDEGILTIIRGACRWSSGKGFRVISPPFEISNAGVMSQEE